MSIEKEKLVYACRWDKVMERSWSGSAYAILCQLEKKFEIERFDLNDTLGIKLFKVFRKLGLVKGEPSLLPLINVTNKKFKKKYGEKKVRVFQFSEAPITDNTENYIYQDLSVSYLLYLKKNEPETYKLCGFSNLSLKELEKRAEIQNEFYMRCNGIFTMGQWLADFLHENCGVPTEKLHVVGAGFNIPEVALDISKRKGNKILFVGRDYKRKGGELVVKAFKILKERYRRDAELYIVGPSDNPLKEEIAGVYYAGNLNKGEVAEYYEKCDIFCMPSYFEAYGIVFSEALISGLPCIARDKYAMKEIVRDGIDGLLLKEESEEELASMMNELLKDEIIKNQVLKNRQEYVDKYSWEHVADQIERVIKGEHAR